MTISGGTRLGPYEILAPLGAGGMGEVYRARDTRLDREVAIKVLPEHLARDKERILRFEREAKLLASLNHPQVAAIYGFEDAGNMKFLVLEYVEGETLAQRLKRGALPVEEALDAGRQMSEALEAAHEKGIIHRDLKPGNVMIRPDGTVKVLDFGLARALTEGSVLGSASADSPTMPVNSPTITADFTRPGVILGTAAYMSPEQARGRSLDKRTDIWSFGVILHECLTGVALFRGESATDSMGAILHKEPDWTALPRSTPPTVQLLLRRCLAKDRNQRLHDIADARIELENAIADPTSSSLRLAATAVEEAGQRRVRSVWRQAIPWLFCVVLAAVLATVVVSPREGGHSNERQVMRLSTPAPMITSLANSLAIAPDGQYLVYRTDGSTAKTNLYVRRLNEFGERSLAGAEGATAPFVSPDGSEIGYCTDRDLRIVSVSGGAPRRLCDAVGNVTGAWGPDGTIVFSTGRAGDGALPGLSRVSATGGVPEVLTTVDPKKNERAHVMPEFLPDGKHVLFSIVSGTAWSVAVLSLETRQYQVLLENASQPLYAPTGHLVFYSYDDVTIFAVPFDATTMRVTDRRVQLIDGMTRQAVFSQNGTLTYVPLRPDEGTVAVWVDRQGNETSIPVAPNSWIEPRLSPDGTKLILRQAQSPDCVLWLYDLDRSTLSRLTFEGDSHGPVWDSAGRYVLFGLDKFNMRSLHKVPFDGSSPPEEVWKGQGPEYPGRGTRDGSLLPFVEEDVDTNQDIWVLSQQGEAKATPFLRTSFREGTPAFSPDGKWIAYTSNESGHDDVYLRPYPGPGAKTLVSTEAGSGPLWSKDGKELFYAYADAMMVVEIELEPTLRISAPRKLFDGPFAWDRTLNYDLAPDGQRFVMLKPPSGVAAARELRVVVNWFEELKAKVPTPK